MANIGYNQPVIGIKKFVVLDVAGNIETGAG